MHASYMLLRLGVLRAKGHGCTNLALKHIIDLRRGTHHAMLQEAGMEALQDGLMTSIPSAMASHACESASHLTLRQRTHATQSQLLNPLSGRPCTTQQMAGLLL